jgi:hypothetical protein
VSGKYYNIDGLASVPSVSPWSGRRKQGMMMMMICAIFESLTAVLLKIQAFWDVTLG